MECCGTESPYVFLREKCSLTVRLRLGRFRSEASVGPAKPPTGPRKARPDDRLRAVPTNAFREALMKVARGQRFAMAPFGIGVVVGPVLGPVLGG